MLVAQLACQSPLGILPPTLVPFVLHPSGQTGSQVPPFFRCDGILLSSKVTLLAVSTASCKSHHLLDTHLTPTMTVAIVSMKRARPSQTWMCSALYKCQGPGLNLGADSPLELHFYIKILKYICRCLWVFKMMILICYIANWPIWATLQALSQKLNQKMTFFPNQVVPAGLFLLHVPCQISLCPNTRSARHSFPLPLPAPGTERMAFLQGCSRGALEQCCECTPALPRGASTALWALSRSFSEFLPSAETPGWCLHQLCSSFLLIQNDLLCLYASAIK